jgi:phospholipase C
MALSDIQTIVFCMMENRSFDHALGYLRADGILPVEGLRAEQSWLDGWINVARGKDYPLHELSLAEAIDDPPHGFQSIATQLTKAAKGQPAMGGFVEAYLDSREKKKAPAPTPGAVMGYYRGEAVPTFDFFARHYCVCDHWFAPLPLGTQANRLMAMSGESRVLDNETGLPLQSLVYDWLNRNDVKWRAYQSGGYFPFFALMDRWTTQILASIAFGGPFRRYKKFKEEWQDNSKAIRPVVFIEPEYSDGPHSQPNDDHPPTSIAGGQAFLRDVYETLVSNPQRWARTLFIVTYDEHGGFFDHVSPIAVPGKAKDTAFATTGLRVPAFLISPWVKPGSVYSRNLDHTSFLALLAERFTPGHGYSVAVNDRQAHLNGRLSAALEPAAQAGAPPRMAALEVKSAAEAPAPPLAVAPNAPDTPNAVAFDRLARRLKQDRPDILSHPEMGEVRAYLRQAPVPMPVDKDHIADRG